jgi:hypothetical protein
LGLALSRDGGRPDEEELGQLEEAMFRNETRGDREWLERHLAPDFIEFGRSGKRYPRRVLIEFEVASTIDVNAILPLPEFRMTGLTPDCVLLTCVSEVGGERANRSSVWTRSDDGWVLRFHQATPPQ